MIDERLTIPIYQQIANEIEDMILNGELKEESQAPSMNQLADYYKINPATARKGLEILTNEDILYKKRGIGMFVSTGAVERIVRNRKEDFMKNYIITLLEEAGKLGLTRQEIISMIERAGKGGQRNE
ncbi:MAG: GntR family transcriptional regulator [Eubacteriales bacterium]|nr:GntR family transcriptional regulator [Eubacteriales bacterium]